MISRNGWCRLVLDTAVQIQVNSSCYDLHIGRPSGASRGVIAPLCRRSHNRYWQPVPGSRQTRTSSPPALSPRTLPSTVVALIGADSNLSHAATPTAPRIQNASADLRTSRTPIDLIRVSLRYASHYASATLFRRSARGDDDCCPPAFRQGIGRFERQLESLRIAADGATNAQFARWPIGSPRRTVRSGAQSSLNAMAPCFHSNTIVEPSRKRPISSPFFSTIFWLA